MLVCDECYVSAEKVPLRIQGIYYKGKPEHVVISVLCQKCDTGKEETEKKLP